MQTTLTIDAQVMGRKQPLIRDWKIPLSFSRDTLTLRDLITQVVLAEVAAFRERQAEQRLTHVLTADQIELSAARGKVEMGGRDWEQPVDPQQAVSTALQAFADGLYFVFVDGQQAQHLDAPITVQADSRVRFVRLMMLAGG